MLAMVPQLALVDWVALVIAAVLLAAVVAALVIAWIASRHKRKVERLGTPSRTGRTVVRRSTPERCLLYTSPSPRDKRQSRMPSSA